MMIRTSRQQTADSRQETATPPRLPFDNTEEGWGSGKKEASIKKGSSLSTSTGFSLVELMVTMTVFVFVLAAGSQIFTAMLTQFKQQSKIGETDIEGAIGLDLLRRDLAQTGYGLPWNVSSPATWGSISGYYEAATRASISGESTALANVADPASFNDGDAGTGTGGSAPRAVLSGSSLFNNAGAGTATDNGQSYLVIKSAVAATNFAAGKSTNLNSIALPTILTPHKENVNAKDNSTADDVNNAVRVIVLSPGTGPATFHSLVVSGTNWFTTYTNSPAPPTLPDAFASGFAPNAGSTNVIYGIDDNHDLRMPFNRADYYIRRPSDIPNRCAPNTGVLYKATVNQNGGGLNEMPILDCVAYMHVDYMLDSNLDGAVDAISDNIVNDVQADVGDCPGDGATVTSTTACRIRNELKEIRVYIIAQEGQRDANYDFSIGETRTNFTIQTEAVGAFSRGPIYFPYSGVPGTPGDLSTLICPGGGACAQEYKHYRWKLYTLVVQPNSLR